MVSIDTTNCPTKIGPYTAPWTMKRSCLLACGPLKNVLKKYFHCTSSKTYSKKRYTFGIAVVVHSASVVVSSESKDACQITIRCRIKSIMLLYATDWLTNAV